MDPQLTRKQPTPLPSMPPRWILPRLIRQTTSITGPTLDSEQPLPVRMVTPRT